MRKALYVVSVRSLQCKIIPCDDRLHGKVQTHSYVWLIIHSCISTYSQLAIQ